MKILLVTPMPPQPQAPGAIPMVLYAQLTGLLARHHQVTLLTLSGDDPTDADAIARLKSDGIRVEAAYRVARRGLPRWQRRWWLASGWLGGKYPWRTLWFYEPELQRLLDHLLNQENFDLVAVEDNALGLYRYRTTVPIVFTEYEVRRPRPVNWRGCSKGNLLWWALGEADWQRWPRYERALWPRFDRIQVFTPEDARAIRQMTPELSERIRVNPFGIALARPLDPTKEEPGQLVLSGNFSHLPNVDGALWLVKEIMPILRRRYPGVKLSIVGNAPPPSVKALACEDIVVTGRVSEIEPYLERASVILAPLRIGGGQRMKVLQGMALGKAVVTTPRGAQGLSIAQIAPPLAIASNAEAFAEATSHLLKNTAARRKLGQQARAFVEQHYSQAAYAERLEAVYAELCSTGVKV